MATILIVGDYWSAEETRTGQPFTSGTGYLFRSLLKQAGIAESDCHFTYVFNQQPLTDAVDKLSYFCGPQNTALKGWPRIGTRLFVNQYFAPELSRLYEEIERIKPNVILALGATPLWALTKKNGIKKHRGSPTVTFTGENKVIPTYHPSAVIRQWSLRPIVIQDLLKTKREATFPALIRPERFLYIEPTLDDLEWFWQKYIEPASVVSTDIETKQGTITEVGFAPRPDRALIVPFYTRDGRHNYWPDAASEFTAWQFVKCVCETKSLVGQNLSYDIQYLWRTAGVKCNRIADDTMILHHSLYPEMEKGLGFLGSIYTNEPSWKFMRQDAELLKAEDD